MIWMETPTPNLKIAKQFADGLRQYHPKKFLSYNLSPSFNWDAAGMTDKEIGDFCSELGKLGYVWQVFFKLIYNGLIFVSLLHLLDSI